MALADLADWIQEFARPGNVFFLKRLSANDTLANGTHQAGPYFPRQLLFSQFPRIADSSVQNPDERVEAVVDSHSQQVTVRAVWYNNRLFGGTRNEARITNWGGVSSPVLDPGNTGAIAIFAFREASGGKQLRVWVCCSIEEEDLASERFGQIEPGVPIAWAAQQGQLELGESPLAGGSSCRLLKGEIPRDWLVTFPSGADLVEFAVTRRDLAALPIDDRLLERRKCEFEIFRSVEEAFEGPAIAQGFDSIDEFVARAQTILQRRKSRSGRSLELHVCRILTEVGFVEGESFSHQPESEQGKRPDFLFPSESAYKDKSFDASRLRLLASKTTCKDRWRQVISEGDRVPVKHLLTLQEGVSVGQMDEMAAAGVKLVVPRRLFPAYPTEIRDQLYTLEKFVNEVRSLQSVAISADYFSNR